MAITQDELQSIVSAVLSSIRTNSRTIDQLTPVTSLSDTDSFEINGGKKVAYEILRDFIISIEAETRDREINIVKKSINTLSETVSSHNIVISSLLNNSVALEDLDKLKDIQNAPGIAAIEQDESARNAGILFCISDSMMHLLIQIVLGNYTIDNNGKLSVAHNDGEVSFLIRNYYYTFTPHIPSGITANSWGPWTKIELTGLESRMKTLIISEQESRKNDISALRATVDDERTDREAAIKDTAGALRALIDDEATDREAAVEGVRGELLAANAAIRALVDDERADRERDITALQEAVWPLTVTLHVSPFTIEVGKNTEVTVSWDVRRKGAVVDAVVSWVSPPPASAIAAGVKNKVITLSPESEGKTTLSVKADFGGMSKTASVMVSAVYPSYFGKVPASGAVTADMAVALTKMINPSKAMTQSSISLVDQRLCLAYPQSFGALTSVKDGNNFETLAAYTRTSLTIGGVAYYCYTMKEPVTAGGVTQIYS